MHEGAVAIKDVSVKVAIRQVEFHGPNLPVSGDNATFVFAGNCELSAAVGGCSVVRGCGLLIFLGGRFRRQNFDDLGVGGATFKELFEHSAGETLPGFFGFDFAEG